MRWLLLIAPLVLGPPFAHPYPEAVITIESFEVAPVLVTGWVTAIEHGPLLRVPSLSTNRDLIESTAVVEVLRSRSISEGLLAPEPHQTIRIRFYSHPNGGGGVMFGPSLPSIELDELHVFPLRASNGLWRLSRDRGSQLTVRATAESLNQPNDIKDSRDYLLTEIAGVLAQGTAAEVVDIARSLQSFLSGTAAETTPEIYAQLDAAVGDDLERWASIAVLYSFGQPIFTDSATGKVILPETRIVERATQRLSRSPQGVRLLATALLDNMPLFPGRRGPVLNLASEPILIAGLRNGLNEDVPGSSPLAYTLVQAGHDELLPEALGRALRVADSPESHYNDITAAGNTVRDFGDERHLRAYAALVRKYQAGNPEHYRSLWQRATGPDTRTSAYVLAVVLEDRRVAFRGIRRCDQAVGYLERAPGEDFGSNPEGPIPARDQAIERAFTWLRTHGIVD